MLKCFPNCFFKLIILHSITRYTKLAACPHNQDLTLLYSKWERSKICLFLCPKYPSTIVLVWTVFGEQAQLWHRTNYSKAPFSSEHMWSRGSNRHYLISLPEVPSEICSSTSAHIQPQGPKPKQSLAWPFLLILTDWRCDEKHVRCAPKLCVQFAPWLRVVISLAPWTLCPFLQWYHWLQPDFLFIYKTKTFYLGLLVRADLELSKNRWT